MHTNVVTWLMFYITLMIKADYAILQKCFTDLIYSSFLHISSKPEGQCFVIIQTTEKKWLLSGTKRNHSTNVFDLISSLFSADCLWWLKYLLCVTTERWRNAAKDYKVPTKWNIWHYASSEHSVNKYACWCITEWMVAGQSFHLTLKKTFFHLYKAWFHLGNIKAL